MTDSAESIIPSLDESRATFKRGFLEWSCLAHTASKTAPLALLDHMRCIETAFPDYPQFPSCLELERSPGSLSATGSSSWAACGSVETAFRRLGSASEGMNGYVRCSMRKKRTL